MDAREYFINIRKGFYTVKAIREEIDELTSLSQRAGAMDYSIERVQTGEAIKEPSFVKVLDRISDVVIKYEARVQEILKEREEAFRQLQLLDDGLKIEIIYCKFFQNMTLEQIAKAKHYTLDTVKYHYFKGMDEFDERRLWEK